MKRVASLPRGAAPAALLAAALLAPDAMAQSCNVKRGTSFDATFSFQEQLVPGAVCPIPLPNSPMVFKLDGAGTADGSIGSIGVSSQNCVIPSGRILGGLDFVGPRFVLSTANGDQLVAAYIGTAAPALSTGGLYNLQGAYTILGGTGRFKNAQGCGTLSGSETVSFAGLPSGKGQITLQGVISYKSGKNDDNDD